MLQKLKLQFLIDQAAFPKQFCQIVRKLIFILIRHNEMIS